MGFWEDFWKNLTDDPRDRAPGPFNNEISRNIPVVGGWSGLVTNAANDFARSLGGQQQQAPAPIAQESPNKGFAQIFRSAMPELSPYESARNEEIKKLQGILRSDYGGVDPSSPLYTGLQNSFNGMNDAVARARQSANDNFTTSNNNIVGMYNNAVGQIKGDDAANIQKNNASYGQAIGKNFDGVLQSINADKTKDMQRQAEIMQRYGLTDAQMAQPQERNQLIDNLTAQKAAATQQADTYGQADLARNVSMAQAVGAEGLQRRGDLRQQLNSILGTLADKEAEIEMNRQNALRGYAQDDYGQFLKTRDQASGDLRGLISDQESADLERQKLAQTQQQGSNSMFDVALRGISNVAGVNPVDIANAYAQARSEAATDYNNVTGTNYEDFLLRRMQGIFGNNWNQNTQQAALHYIQGLKSYGTDKQTAR